MNIQHSDIILVGGGIAGMTAAAAFGTAGFSVALVDPSLAKQSNDLRSTAFLQPARALLARAGLWDLFEPHAAPLKIMRIIDAGGPPDAAAVSADFDASEIGDGPFGWNLPNMAIRQAALARLAQLPNVTQYPDTRFARLTPRRVEARVALSDGTQLSAKLLIGADGRKSAVRKAAGIGTKIHRYGQKALVFTVRHAPPHNDCSTEVHLSGGPFTMVPLPDADDGHRSAIVWMETSAEAARLMQLDEAAFNDAASHRSAGVLGPLALTSPRQIWPITAQRAERMTAPRLALIAEAAHAIPPIGAQGLNMSLADITCLLDLAIADPAGLGGDKMLTAFAKAREPDVRLRVSGIDALNRSSIAAAPFLHSLRASGIKVLHGAAPLRHSIMKLGLGAGR